MFSPGQKIRCVQQKDFGSFKINVGDIFTVDHISSKYVYVVEYPKQPFFFQRFEVVNSVAEESDGLPSSKKPLKLVSPDEMWEITKEICGR